MRNSFLSQYLVHLLLVSLVHSLPHDGSPLRILCFGDSLTHGFTRGGRVTHPYALSLKSSLQTSHPTLNTTTRVQGQNGDLVTFPPGGFFPRMTYIYMMSSPGEFNYTVILGGTNDLSTLHDANTIYTALKAVWSIPLSHGTKVLALTVPESGSWSEEILQRRRELNELILAHREEGFFTFDLGAKVPYHDMPPENRSEIWDDETHFTPKGYDLVGTLVAGRIEELLSPSSGEGRGLPGCSYLVYLWRLVVVQTASLVLW